MLQNLIFIIIVPLHSLMSKILSLCKIQCLRISTFTKFNVEITDPSQSKNQTLYKIRYLKSGHLSEIYIKQKLHHAWFFPHQVSHFSSSFTLLTKRLSDCVFWVKVISLVTKEQWHRHTWSGDSKDELKQCVTFNLKVSYTVDSHYNDRMGTTRFGSL